MNDAITTHLFSRKIKLVNHQFYSLNLYYSSDLYLYLFSCASGISGYPSVNPLGYNGDHKPVFKKHISWFSSIS